MVIALCGPSRLVLDIIPGRFIVRESRMCRCRRREVGWNGRSKRILDAKAQGIKEKRPKVRKVVRYYTCIWASPTGEGRQAGTARLKGQGESDPS